MNDQRPAPGELCLDHVAHFLPDIGAAAAVLESLGFAVTPLSAQQTQDGPAGTSNRCVMLSEGYLEFLTPTLDTPVAARMRVYMAKHVGVHLACFGTPSAEAEFARLAAHGFEPLPMVRLSRRLDDGQTARFNVVRVPPERMPEGRVQFVEHLTPDVIWREADLAHVNGVIGLAAAFVVAYNPVAVAARYAEFSALLPRMEDGFIRLASERGDIIVGTSAQWAQRLGSAPAAPALAGYALKCRDPAAFAQRCAAAGLNVNGNIVQLPPVLGGAWELR